MKCPRCGSDDIFEEEAKETVEEKLLVCNACGHSWWIHDNPSKNIEL